MTTVRKTISIENYSALTDSSSLIYSSENTSFTSSQNVFTGETGSTRVMTANEYGQTAANDELIDLVVSFTTTDSIGNSLYQESGWTNNIILRDGYEGQISQGTGQMGCSYYCNCTSLGTWKRTYMNPYITYTATTSVLEDEDNWSNTIVTGTTGDVGMRYMGTDYEYICTSYQTWKRYPTNASYLDITYSSSATTFFQDEDNWSNQIFIGGQLSGNSEFHEAQWYGDYNYFYHKINETLYRQPILNQTQSGITSVSASTDGNFSGLTETTNLTLTSISSGGWTDINNNFNDISSQYNKLRMDYEDLRTKFNTLLTYLQNHKLIS